MPHARVWSEGCVAFRAKRAGSARHIQPRKVQHRGGGQVLAPLQARRAPANLQRAQASAVRRGTDLTCVSCLTSLTTPSPMATRSVPTAHRRSKAWWLSLKKCVSRPVASRDPAKPVADATADCRRYTPSASPDAGCRLHSTPDNATDCPLARRQRTARAGMRAHTLQSSSKGRQ